MFDLSFAEYTRQQKRKDPRYIYYKKREAAERKAKADKMEAKMKLVDDLRAAASRYVAQRVPTEAEKIVANQLGELSIFYKQEHPIIISSKSVLKLYIMDFYLYQQNICLEIDGGYHTTAEQREYDATRDKNISPPTIRIPNEAVLAPGFSLLDWL